MTTGETEKTICDRYWLLAWTMYGNWLPGDSRAFVSNVRDGDGPEVRHNVPGTEYDSGMPNLEKHARGRMKGDPVRIDVRQSEVLFEQFQETAGYRGWRLLRWALWRITATWWSVSPAIQNLKLCCRVSKATAVVC